MNVKKILCVPIVLICLATVTASSALGCYTVVAGKEASADGAVLVGHNEQYGPRIMNFRIIPRMTHKPGEVVKLLRGGALPEVPETYSFMWSENPRGEFGDTYMNEWGVAVVSNECRTRERSYRALTWRGDIVDGGIGYMLRRLVVQRAKTAREGVQLAGELLDRLGYSDSGRTLILADPNEAWLLSIVRGKHWIAQRVPDDEVVLLANEHIISDIDLDDTDRFAGSPDIVAYAIERGWFKPERDGAFSFRAAYNERDPRDMRQWQGQDLVRGHPPDRAGTQLPFSVKREHKLSVKDVLNILRYHGDGGICVHATQEASVFQLRGWLPPEIGCIYWRVSAEPCCGVLVPWYLGITETPDIYYKSVDAREHLTLSFHFRPPRKTYDDPGLAWWTFMTLTDLVHEDYQASIEKVRAVWDDFEANVFADQPAVEEEALRLFSLDQGSARLYLTNYSKKLGLQAFDMTKEMIQDLGERR